MLLVDGCKVRQARNNLYQCYIVNEESPVTLQLSVFGAASMSVILRRFSKSRSGATLIEYALIVCLIASAAVGSMTNVGLGIQNVMNAVVAALN
jgi:Flp pilus assembly pilin Flp